MPTVARMTDVGLIGPGDLDAPFANVGGATRSRRQYIADAAALAERLPSAGAMLNLTVDRLLALFPFEPPLYAGARLAVTFVGHPLAAQAATAATRRETRELLRFGAKQAIFALLPGSRMSELEMHTELVLRTAAELFEAQPDAGFLVPLVSREARDYFDVVRYRLHPEFERATLAQAVRAYADRGSHD